MDILAATLHTDDVFFTSNRTEDFERGPARIARKFINRHKSYICYRIAIASISTFTSLGNRATWMAARAG